MEVTETHVNLDPNRTSPTARVLAYAAVVFDDQLALNHIRVIRSPTGGLIVSMPSLPRNEPCPKCRRTCGVMDRFCRHCGVNLGDPRVEAGSLRGYHKDLAHPINNPFRDYLDRVVIDAFKAKVAEAEAAEIEAA